MPPFRLIAEIGVEVPMRDGVALATDIYRPASDEPVPAVLMRTPYDRNLALLEPFYDLFRMVRAGYALVVQDTRGRYASDGDFSPFRHESDDGEDTIAWLRRTPWSTGRIGMIGASYAGATQWLTSVRNPEGLMAICPIVTGADYRDGWLYHDGAFELGCMLQWSIWLSGDTARRRADEDPSANDLRTRVIDAGNRVESLYRALDPDATSLFQEVAPYYLHWRPRPSRPSEWDAIAPDLRPELATAPALNVGGWYDLFQQGTVECYRRQRDVARSSGRPGPRLIIGPWTHSIYSGMFVGRRFGVGSAIGEFDLAGEQIRWFDRWLKEEPNGIDQEAPVRVFVMGSDQWEDFADFPPPSAVATSLFLETTETPRRGSLSRTAPGSAGSELLRVNPADPVPTLGGGTLLEGTWVADRAGPADLRPWIKRSDVLVYESATLASPLKVVGPVELTVFASPAAGSATGFDVVAHLVDVYPSGRMEVLTSGISRVAGAIGDSPITVRVGASAAVFRAGHKIGLILAGSDFPRFDVNPDIVAARGGAVRIDTSAERPSRLTLQVTSR